MGPRDMERAGQGHTLNDNATVALSPAEVRRRRLAALEGTASIEPPPPAAPSPRARHALVVDDEEQDLQAAVALSLQPSNDTVEEEREPTDNVQDSSSQAFDISTFHSIMWDSLVTTDNDKSRWINQGIDIRDKMDVDLQNQNFGTMLALVGSNHGPWGLTQAHGGPCGVLAAVQAEMLCLLLFGPRNPLRYPTDIQTQPPQPLSREVVREAMAMAIAIIIARATLMPCAADNDSQSLDKKCACIVLPCPSEDDASYTGLTWQDLEPWCSGTATASSKLQVHSVPAQSLSNLSAKRQKTGLQERIIQLASAISNFLLHSPGEPLQYFIKPGGVILLTISLVSSRGAFTIRKEFDDSIGTKLTSQFGHSSQELMNLLLTGQAVSNVFDNTLTPSGALTCRGVQSRSRVGYLSQLEAMRYCEVGGYYKNPHFPVWVVGSTSHFTVLFGDATCLRESESDVLLEKCKRAFKSVEGGEENGFISTESLASCFQLLELDVGGESAIQTLAASLQVTGVGIILWDDFWKATSRLLTGASLDSVIGTDGDDEDEMPPLLLTEHGEAANQTAAAAAAPAPPAHQESDEEMARRLAAEWGSSPAAAAAARPSSPMEMDTTAAVSDEELARRLQAEWNSEISATASVDAVNGSPNPADDDDDVPDLEQVVADSKMPAAGEDSKMPAAGDSKMPADADDDVKMPALEDTTARKLDFETFGNSFFLYHYNGLRGGSLTPFRVTRLSPEEAVGTSVALTNTRGTSGEKGLDLEDVVRTKWPSCMIDWLGKQPPYID